MVAANRKQKRDIVLVLALSCGSTPESAAQRAGVSVRTVYRRLADPTFCVQIDEARMAHALRTADMLAAAGATAIKTLVNLVDSATSESVRLGAARAVIELSLKLRENVDLAQRVRTLEASWEHLIQGVPNLETATVQEGASSGEGDNHYDQNSAQADGIARQSSGGGAAS